MLPGWFLIFLNLIIPCTADARYCLSVLLVLFFILL